MNSLARLLVGSLVAAASVLSLPAASVVADGGFENPDVSGPLLQGYVTGQSFGAWTVDYAYYDAVVIHDDYTGGGVTWANPVEGKQFLYLADSITVSTVSQVVTLAGGHTYDFSFWLADFASMNFGNGAWVSANLTSLANPALSLFGGATVFSHGPSPVFHEHGLGFSVADSGDYKLSFTSQNGFAANLDDVAIIDVTKPATHGVPDSGATLGLAAIGGALLGLARRFGGHLR